MSKPSTANPRARNQQGRSRHAQQLRLLELQVRNQILAEARLARDSCAAATGSKKQGGSNS